MRGTAPNSYSIPTNRPYSTPCERWRTRWLLSTALIGDCSMAIGDWRLQHGDVVIGDGSRRSPIAVLRSEIAREALQDSGWHGDKVVWRWMHSRRSATHYDVCRTISWDCMCAGSSLDPPRRPGPTMLKLAVPSRGGISCTRYRSVSRSSARHRCGCVSFSGLAGRTPMSVDWPLSATSSSRRSSGASTPPWRRGPGRERDESSAIFVSSIKTPTS